GQASRRDGRKLDLDFFDRGAARKADQCLVEACAVVFQCRRRLAVDDTALIRPLVGTYGNVGRTCNGKRTPLAGKGRFQGKIQRADDTDCEIRGGGSTAGDRVVYFYSVGISVIRGYRLGS